VSDENDATTVINKIHNHLVQKMKIAFSRHEKSTRDRPLNILHDSLRNRWRVQRRRTRYRKASVPFEERWSDLSLIVEVVKSERRSRRILLQLTRARRGT